MWSYFATQFSGVTNVTDMIRKYDTFVNAWFATGQICLSMCENPSMACYRRHLTPHYILYTRYCLDPRPYCSKYSNTCQRNKRCAPTCNVTNTHNPSSNSHTAQSKAFGSRNRRTLNEQTDTQCRQLRMGLCPSSIQNERSSFSESYVHEHDGLKSQHHVILFLARPVFSPTQLPPVIYRVTNMVNHGDCCPSW